MALYHRCQSRPISESIITARWRLFGHVLRLPRDAPAQRAIDHYFANTEAATFRGRPRTSLPSTLCWDLRRIGRTLRQPADIEALRALSREQCIQENVESFTFGELQVLKFGAVFNTEIYIEFVHHKTTNMIYLMLL